MGKFPIRLFKVAKDAGTVGQAAVVGVQVVANPGRPPNAAGCNPVWAMDELAPARKRYFCSAALSAGFTAGLRNTAEIVEFEKNATCSGVRSRLLPPGPKGTVSRAK